MLDLFKESYRETVICDNFLEQDLRDNCNAFAVLSASIVIWWSQIEFSVAALDKDRKC